VSIPPYIDSVSGTIYGTSEALRCAIQLSLKRPDHAAERFGRSNEHRFANGFAPTRR
jgi:hypothetical protein